MYNPFLYIYNIYIFENSGYVISKEHHPMEEGSTNWDLIAFFSFQFIEGFPD